MFSSVNHSGSHRRNNNLKKLLPHDDDKRIIAIYNIHIHGLVPVNVPIDSHLKLKSNAFLSRCGYELKASGADRKRGEDGRKADPVHKRTI
jgi:hypothetical protein